MGAAGERRRSWWPARCLLVVLAVAGLVAGPAATSALAAPGTTQIAAGDHHTCVLRSGSVSCWGADDRGNWATALPLTGPTRPRSTCPAWGW